MRARSLARAICVIGLAAAVALPAAAAPSHVEGAEERALGSLVDAEYAFARMGWERGVRAAFLANFAADGVMLTPKPERPRDAWHSQPLPADPLSTRLEWAPAQAGVSRSRDLGYTTGPYAAWDSTRTATKDRGVFFSVWQRVAGNWKVILDAGISTPGTVDFASLGEAPRPHSTLRAVSASVRGRLLAQEASGFGAQTRSLTPNDYAKLLADDARWHRDGRTPLASRAAIAAEIARTTRRVRWTPAGARVSAAGDMAVTYGAYAETDRGWSMRQGYYAHLWLRDASGRWRIAYDIARAAAP